MQGRLPELLQPKPKHDEAEEDESSEEDEDDSSDETNQTGSDETNQYTAGLKLDTDVTDVKLEGAEVEPPHNLSLHALQRETQYIDGITKPSLAPGVGPPNPKLQTDLQTSVQRQMIESHSPPAISRDKTGGFGERLPGRFSGQLPVTRTGGFSGRLPMPTPHPPLSPLKTPDSDPAKKTMPPPPPRPPRCSLPASGFEQAPPAAVELQQRTCSGATEAMDQPIFPAPRDGQQQHRMPGIRQPNDFVNAQFNTFLNATGTFF
jgi:hypothetical protein